MNEVEKSTLSLSSDLDDASAEEEAIKQDLQKVGFSNKDQEWLVEFFKRRDTFRDPNGAAVFRDDFIDFFEQIFPNIVAKLGEPVQTEKDRQTRFALLFSSMLDFGPGSNTWLLPNHKLDKSSDTSSQPEWISEFQRHANFDFKSLNRDKLSEISNHAIFRFNDLLLFLFPEPLSQIVDLSLPIPIQRSRPIDNGFKDSEQLEYWLTWRFRDNKKRSDTIRLNTLLQTFSDFPEDVLVDKIFGLLDAIRYAMSVDPMRLNPGGNGWRVVAHELVPFLELLTAKDPDSSQERSSLLKVWWHLSNVIYGWSMGGLEDELSPELENRLVESATRHIGILRSVLRDTPKVFKGKDSTGTVSDFYKEAFHILLNFADPWKCLKPLLLAFTGLPVQAVTSDLRAWPELGRKEELPRYSNVALWVAIAMYPQNLQKELDRDPHLQDLREELAKFCLERLKTKGKQKVSGEDKQLTDKDFVEPRPLWRQGYVQALAALRVNPGGRAHRTLFWLSENDPNEEVCALAKRAHKQIRHLDRKKPNLDEGASPRRPLFEAFWWLRQAHLLHLGITPDPAGAMRTRRRELHRTREKDDNWGRTR